MKYLIIGAGGTGGCIGGYLALGGNNVTFIARGPHLRAIQENGLIIHSPRQGDRKVINIQAYDTLNGMQKYDAIFVCVKGYSINEILPLLKQASNEKTVIIPILNALNEGERLKKVLPGLTILGGCIYVSAYIWAPGEIMQSTEYIRVVFGVLEGTWPDKKQIQDIRNDLINANIDGIISNDIRRDVFRKFSFTSAFAAVGAYFDAAAGEFQKDGECRDMFLALQQELLKVADALKIRLNVDLANENLRIMESLNPDTTASMQKDLKAGKTSETDALIFDVVRVAEKYNIDVPNYRKIAEHFGY